MTNAEKIKDTVDEELIDTVLGERYCPPDRDYVNCDFESPCRECRLMWLQEEAVDEI